MCLHRHRAASAGSVTENLLGLKSVPSCDPSQYGCFCDNPHLQYEYSPGLRNTRLHFFSTIFGSSIITMVNEYLPTVITKVWPLFSLQEYSRILILMSYNNYSEVPRDKNFWKALPKPIIGLAPMDGYSDSAFRHVCKFVNPNIVTFTEFTSADGIHHGAKRLQEKLYFHPEEQPVFAQIFGKNRETYITAAKCVEDMGYSGVDINMGCPSKKVVRSEHGVALRKKPDLACELVRAVAESVSIPVSVKTRLGWSDASDLIPFSQQIEQAGANMICIHARTYKEPYNVPAMWEYLYELKKHISIPVIGNGGVTSYQEAIDKIRNLDGCLIGQATFGNPWVFTSEGKPDKFSERLPVILKHADWLIQHKSERVGCFQIRKHLLNYTKGFHGAKAYRTQLQQVQSLEEIFSILDEMKRVLD